MPLGTDEGELAEVWAKFGGLVEQHTPFYRERRGPAASTQPRPPSSVIIFTRDET